MTNPRAMIGDIPVFCAYDEIIQTETLIQNPKNPNKHPESQIELLAKIIKAQGWRAPITVSNRSGFIVRGHGRLMAAQLIGTDSVPVDFQDYESEADEYADLIADNRLSELSDNDDEKLAELLKEINDDEFDMSLTGYDDEFLDELFANYSDDYITNQDYADDGCSADIKDIPNAKIGDIYRLGNHRLMCGDSTNIESVRLLMDGEKSDLMFTSPPYGAANSAKLREHYDKRDEALQSFYNSHNDSPDEWMDLMNGMFESAKEFSEQQIVNVQMLADNKVDLIKFLHAHSDTFCDCIIWDKGHGAPQMHENVLNNSFEFVFVFGNKTRTIKYADFKGSESNIWRINRTPNEYSDIHKAVFPVELPAKAISMCNKSKTVLDLFGGTGSTMIACEQLNRTCYMMELDPRYVDIIIDRWEQFTGDKAILLNENKKGA